MAKNAMRLAPPLLLAGALASQAAAAQVLDTRFGFSGLKVQAWSLADGSAVDAGVHFSSAHVFGEILNTCSRWPGQFLVLPVPVPGQRLLHRRVYQ